MYSFHAEVKKVTLKTTNNFINLFLLCGIQLGKLYNDFPFYKIWEMHITEIQLTVIATSTIVTIKNCH